jgi:hypothetical protein
MIRSSPHDVDEAFDAFARRFSPRAYADYQAALHYEFGAHYDFGTTPLFLTRDQLRGCLAVARAVVQLLHSPTYRARRLADAPAWMVDAPVRRSDLVGSVDLLLGVDGPLVMEVNFNVPGRVGLVEAAERMFFARLGASAAPRQSDGLEDRIAEAVASALKPPVAITVSHTAASAPYLPHYRYLERALTCRGVACEVVYARDVEVTAGGLRWHGRAFGGALNLVIPAVWMAAPESFGRWTEAYRRFPERVVPSPIGGVLGDKALLAALHQLEELAPEVSAADRAILRSATLRAAPLSRFASPEAVSAAFGGRERLVLKPLASYDKRGVYVSPSADELSGVFADARCSTIVQARAEALEAPVLSAEGERRRGRPELRILFWDGAVVGVLAYLHEELGRQAIVPVVPIGAVR